MGSSSGKGQMGLVEALMNPVGYVIPSLRKLDPLTSAIAPTFDKWVGTSGQKYYDDQAKALEASLQPQALTPQISSQISPTTTGVPYTLDSSNLRQGMANNLVSHYNIQDGATTVSDASQIAERKRRTTKTDTTYTGSVLTDEEVS